MLVECLDQAGYNIRYCRADKKAKKAQAEMEVVEAEFDRDMGFAPQKNGARVGKEFDDEEDDLGTGPMTDEKRALIRAGLGRSSVGAAGMNGRMEIVRQGHGAQNGFADEDDVDSESDDSDSGVSLSPDPREEDNDLDTQAELLALGKHLKRYTTAKRLIDAR